MRIAGALLYFGALSSAVVLNRRTPQSVQSIGKDGKKQVFGHNFDLERLAPSIKPVSVVNKKASLRPNSIRKVTTYGPFTIPPMKEGMQVGNQTHGHGGSSASPSQPKALSDILPGMPTITWEDVAKSYQKASVGDYEGAMAIMNSIPLDKEGNVIVRSLKDGYCSDCTVLAVKTDLVYEDGTRVDISNGIYLHHAVSFNLAWKEMANWLNICPFENKAMKDVDLFSYFPKKINIPITLFGNAAVDEFQQWYASPDQKGPEAGYYLSPEDYFMMQAEMINYTKEEKKVFLRFDYEYVPGKVKKESTLTILSTLGCFDALGFYGNGTNGVIRSQDFKVLQNGTIVVARGHLHDGGEHMKVLLNDKPICVSKAVYGTKLNDASGRKWTTISRMTDCVDPVAVKKGDKIVLETKFDEASHPLRMSHGKKQEEMGIMEFTFVPE